MYTYIIYIYTYIYIYIYIYIYLSHVCVLRCILSIFVTGASARRSRRGLYLVVFNTVQFLATVSFQNFMFVFAA